MVRSDVPGESLMLHGVVAPSDASGATVPPGSTAALFALVRTRTGPAEQPGRVFIPGLEPDREYRVEPVFPAPGDADYSHTFAQVKPPAWLADSAIAGGHFLAEVGLPMPVLNPEHALLLRITAL